MTEKKMVILGGGESGAGAAVLGKKLGYTVFLSDKGMLKDAYKNELNSLGIAFEEGHHSEEKILDASMVIKSPGIPDNAPIVKAIREKGIPVISEIELAANNTNAKLIAITGTNGKTTTTLLTYHILKKAGLNVGLAGNVGKSFARQVANETHDFYVLELSSFQLDGMYNTRIHIAILCNITPDHLDRYEYKLENYVQSKFRILQNQTEHDFFIYCDDDPIISNYLSKAIISAKKLPFSIKHNLSEGAWLQGKEITIDTNQNPLHMSLDDLSLQGKHNAYNSMAAGISARVLEIRKEIIRESLSDFENIEHRLEFVAKVNGIEFINDSKATNVNSTWYALESMQNPTVWIVGGQDKGNDYDMLLDLAKEKVKAIVCLGVDNSKIIEAFSKSVTQIVETGNAQDAVMTAYRIAKKGDTVLLSPACASFDLFENYEDRGRQFKHAVRRL
jgi:UDP-N-acetylmuramoylalanine--D-glutamate ligase